MVTEGSMLGSRFIVTLVLPENAPGVQAVTPAGGS